MPLTNFIMKKKKLVPNELISYDKYFKEEDLSKDSELGLAWISGNCSLIYSDLTSLERMIIMYYYDKNYSDNTIGKRLGYHKNTVYLKRRAAIKKIRRP